MLSTKKYCVYVCPAVTWSSLFTLKHSLIFEIQKSTIIKFGVHKWSKVNTTVQCCQNATMFKNNPVQFFRHSCISTSQGTDETDKKWASHLSILNDQFQMDKLDQTPLYQVHEDTGIDITVSFSCCHENSKCTMKNIHQIPLNFNHNRN